MPASASSQPNQTFIKSCFPGYFAVSQGIQKLVIPTSYLKINFDLVGKQGFIHIVGIKYLSKALILVQHKV